MTAGNVVLIFQNRKQRSSWIEEFAQHHRASKWQQWDLNSSIMLFSTLLCVSLQPVRVLVSHLTAPVPGRQRTPVLILSECCHAFFKIAFPAGTQSLTITIIILLEIHFYIIKFREKMYSYYSFFFF